MSSPLNRQPNGLLEFFGIKDGGWGPRTFAQELVPQLDLWRHYVAGNPTDFDGTGTFAGPTGGALLLDVAWTYPITAAGGLTPTIIPQNELWYWDTASIHLLMSTGAGSTLQFATIAESALSPGAFHLLPFAPIEQRTSSGTVSVSQFTALMYPVFLRGGAQLQFFVGLEVPAAETLTARITARGTRMRI
jgi:hypothetical protein